MKDPYEVLGVDRSATQEDIKRTVSEIGVTGEPSAIHFQVVDTSDRF